LAKSTIRTVRIDEDLNQAIEKVARQDKTSVNYVVNSAIREAVEWTTVIPKLGFATFPKYITDKLLDRLTDEECEALGRQIGREFLKPFVEYRFEKPTFEDYIETIREFAKYTGQFKVLTKSRGEGKFVLILEHGSGAKWSHLYKGTGEYALNPPLAKNKTIELTDSHLIITFS